MMNFLILHLYQGNIVDRTDFWKLFITYKIIRKTGYYKPKLILKILN